MTGGSFHILKLPRRGLLETGGGLKCGLSHRFKLRCCFHGAGAATKGDFVSVSFHGSDYLVRGLEIRGGHLRELGTFLFRDRAHTGGSVHDVVIDGEDHIHTATADPESLLGGGVAKGEKEAVEIQDPMRLAVVH